MEYSNQKYVYIRLTRQGIGNPDILTWGIEGYGRIEHDNIDQFRHAEINTTPYDGFYAINTIYDNVIDRSYINGSNADNYNSMYSLYSIPVTDREWKNIKWYLKRMYKEGPKALRYDMTAIAVMGGQIALNKRIGDRNNPINNTRESSDKRQLVTCISFIGRTLYKYVNDFKEWVDNNKVNIGYMAPSDIITYPRMKLLLRCRDSRNYNDDVTKLIKRLGISEMN